MNYLLAHDLGTSGDKAVLFDIDRQEIVADHTCAYETSYPGPGRVEHDPDDWWQAVCTATKLLLEKTGADKDRILGVSFSAIMNTCLAVDGQGRPLRPAMIWSDQRGMDQLDRLHETATEDEFYSVAGHRIDGTYGIAKMLWLKEHEGEVYSRTKYFLQAKDYVIFKLTGVFATDLSDASHLGVLDQRTKHYWLDLLNGVGLDPSLLPELRASTDVIGTVSPLAASETGLSAGTPVVMGGGDGCCATAGAGVYRPGQGYNVLGTSSWIGTLSDRMVDDVDRVSFSFIHLDGKNHVVLGTMQSAGHSLDWLMKTLFPDFGAAKAQRYEEVSSAVEKLLHAPSGYPELYLPYLLGERSPWWNPDARGCFIGLNSSSDSGRLVKACMEGVGFNLRVILEALERTSGPLDMKIIGGGVRNEIWVRILASIWNREIAVPKYVGQATSLGAVLCAGVGIGAFSDFSQIDSVNPTVSHYCPREDLVEAYARIYPVFLRAYQALIPVFHDLKESIA